MAKGLGEIVRFEAIRRSSFEKLSSSADHSPARPRLPVLVHCPIGREGGRTSLATRRNFNASADVPTLLIPSIVFLAQLFAITLCPSLPRFHSRTDIDSQILSISVYLVLLLRFIHRNRES